jgi:plastocyanin
LFVSRPRCTNHGSGMLGKGGRMKRLAIVLAVGALAALGSVPAGYANDAKKHVTIKTRGKNGVRINEIFFSTLRFKPGEVNVKSGGRVTLLHADETQDPHTLTIVRKRELPTTVDEVFQCEACAVAEGHFAGGAPDPVLEDDRDSERGLDGRGDSLLVFAGQHITRKVTARAGRTLSFLCAIHPWMQGRINVR